MKKKRYYKLDRPHIKTEKNDGITLKLTMVDDNKIATVIVYDWQIKDIYQKCAEILAQRTNDSIMNFLKFKASANHINILRRES